MKKSVWLLLLSLAFIGCSKKEDAPPPNNPHVAGMWAGTGTDDAIGYFNISFDLTQSANSASGTFTMVGGVATVTGDVRMDFGGSNLNALVLTRGQWSVTDPANANRLCAATLSVSPHSTSINSSFVAFHYTMTDCQGGTWIGGANLSKTAGTN